MPVVEASSFGKGGHGHTRPKARDLEKSSTCMYMEVQVYCDGTDMSCSLAQMQCNEKPRA